MAYLFDVYMTERKVPNLARIKHIVNKVPRTSGLFNFCVDIYIKWFGRDIIEKGFWYLHLEVAQCPYLFRVRLLERAQQLKQEIMEGRRNWRLELKDYCYHGMTEEC
jgi:hypothetical protein